MTLGVSHICIKEHLSSGVHFIAENFSPIALVILTAIMWHLTRYSWFVRFLQLLQRRRSFVHVWWLVLFYSYTVISVGVFAPLRCTYIYGASVYRHREIHTTCFTTTHTVFFVLAIFGVLFISVLPPILLLSPRVRSWHRINRITEEAVLIYRPETPWWISINLGRRVTLGFIALSTVIIVRDVMMLAFFVTLTILHVSYK